MSLDQTYVSNHQLLVPSKMATSIDPDNLATPYSGSWSSFQESLSAKTVIKSLSLERNEYFIFK